MVINVRKDVEVKSAVNNIIRMKVFLYLFVRYISIFNNQNESINDYL